MELDETATLAAIEADPAALDRLRKDLQRHRNKFVNFLMGRVLKENPKFSPEIARAAINRKLDELEQYISS